MVSNTMKSKELNQIQVSYKKNQRRPELLTTTMLSKNCYICMVPNTMKSEELNQIQVTDQKVRKGLNY